MRCGMSIVTLSCMKMGLIHDLAESIVGDITPVDNVSVEDKHTMERVGVVVDVHPKNAFLKIVSGFPEPLANEFVSLWEEYEKQDLKSFPLGRYGTPEEYGRLAAFLCSEANTYVSGQTILLDGGMTRAY